MKKIIAIIILAAVVGVAAWWYFIRDSESYIPASMSPAKIEAQQKQAEDFEKRFTDAEGQVNKAEVQKYLDERIAEAKAALSKTSPGAPEREKLERRILMLERMKSARQ